MHHQSQNAQQRSQQAISAQQKSQVLSHRSSYVAAVNEQVCSLVKTTSQQQQQHKHSQNQNPNLNQHRKPQPQNHLNHVNSAQTFSTQAENAALMVKSTATITAITASEISNHLQTLKTTPMSSRVLITALTQEMVARRQKVSQKTTIAKVQQMNRGGSVEGGAAERVLAKCGTEPLFKQLKDATAVTPRVGQLQVSKIQLQHASYIKNPPTPLTKTNKALLAAATAHTSRHSPDIRYKKRQSQHHHRSGLLPSQLTLQPNNQIIPSNTSALLKSFVRSDNCNTTSAVNNRGADNLAVIKQGSKALKQYQQLQSYGSAAIINAFKGSLTQLTTTLVGENNKPTLPLSVSNNQILSQKHHNNQSNTDKDIALNQNHQQSSRSPDTIRIRKTTISKHPNTTTNTQNNAGPSKNSIGTSASVQPQQKMIIKEMKNGDVRQTSRESSNNTNANMNATNSKVDLIKITNPFANSTRENNYFKRGGGVNNVKARTVCKNSFSESPSKLQQVALVKPNGKVGKNQQDVGDEQNNMKLVDWVKLSHYLKATKKEKNNDHLAQQTPHEQHLKSFHNGQDFLQMQIKDFAQIQEKNLTLTVTPLRTSLLSPSNNNNEQLSAGGSVGVLKSTGAAAGQRIQNNHDLIVKQQQASISPKKQHVQSQRILELQKKLQSNFVEQNQPRCRNIYRPNTQETSLSSNTMTTTTKNQRQKQLQQKTNSIKLVSIQTSSDNQPKNDLLLEPNTTKRPLQQSMFLFSQDAVTPNALQETTITQSNNISKKAFSKTISGNFFTRATKKHQQQIRPVVSKEDQDRQGGSIDALQRQQMLVKIDTIPLGDPQYENFVISPKYSNEIKPSTSQSKQRKSRKVQQKELLIKQTSFEDMLQDSLPNEQPVFLANQPKTTTASLLEPQNRFQVISPHQEQSSMQKNQPQQQIQTKEIKLQQAFQHSSLSRNEAHQQQTSRSRSQIKTQSTGSTRQRLKEQGSKRKEYEFLINVIEKQTKGVSGAQTMFNQQSQQHQQSVVNRQKSLSPMLARQQSFDNTGTGQGGVGSVNQPNLDLAPSLKASFRAGILTARNANRLTAKRSNKLPQQGLWKHLQSTILIRSQKSNKSISSSIGKRQLSFDKIAVSIPIPQVESEGCQVQQQHVETSCKKIILQQKTTSTQVNSSSIVSTQVSQRFKAAKQQPTGHQQESTRAIHQQNQDILQEAIDYSKVDYTNRLSQQITQQHSQSYEQLQTMSSQPNWQNIQGQSQSYADLKKTQQPYVQVIIHSQQQSQLQQDGRDDTQSSQQQYQFVKQLANKVRKNSKDKNQTKNGVNFAKKCNQLLSTKDINSCFMLKKIEQKATTPKVNSLTTDQQFIPKNDDQDKNANATDREQRNGSSRNVVFHNYVVSHKSNSLSPRTEHDSQNRNIGRLDSQIASTAQKVYQKNAEPEAEPGEQFDYDALENDNEFLGQQQADQKLGQQNLLDALQDESYNFLKNIAKTPSSLIIKSSQSKMSQLKPVKASTKVVSTQRMSVEQSITNSDCVTNSIVNMPYCQQLNYISEPKSVQTSSPIVIQKSGYISKHSSSVKTKPGAETTVQDLLLQQKHRSPNSQEVVQHLIEQIKSNSKEFAQRVRSASKQKSIESVSGDGSMESEDRNHGDDGDYDSEDEEIDLYGLLPLSQSLEQQQDLSKRRDTNIIVAMVNNNDYDNEYQLLKKSDRETERRKISLKSCSGGGQGEGEEGTGSLSPRSGLNQLRMNQLRINGNTTSASNPQKTSPSSLPYFPSPTNKLASHAQSVTQFTANTKTVNLDTPKTSDQATIIHHFGKKIVVGKKQSRKINGGSPAGRRYVGKKNNTIKGGHKVSHKQS